MTFAAASLQKDERNRILIVDDDAEIRDLLCEYLDDAGMETRSAEHGEAMWQVLDSFRPDLIILDLMLPGTDGLALCRALGERMAIPVIMLTARGALIDRIVGLEMGADDYLVKPCDPRELLARIKVVLRRTMLFPPEARVEDVASLRFAGWRLDTRLRQLHARDGGVTALGGSDYLALRLLLRHPHRTLSRDYINLQVYGRERGPLDRAVDVCISRLRQMLEEDARNPSIIRTVRNGGYALSVDVMVEA
ncbi:response regulator [Novosphingobium rosa]|uniref:response regulator n=1 Tax=Novosphingobium rosa TaxID=76978 RepID=UPI0008366478|nr:response regulator [Novosphingobium rosa]